MRCPICLLIAIAVSSLSFAPPALAAEPDAFTAQQTRLLTEAEARLAENPADALLWKGRRLGYLGRFDEAIAVYGAGEKLHPNDARFARNIGHRLISLRRFGAEGRSCGRRSTRLRGSCHASA